MRSEETDKRPVRPIIPRSPAEPLRTSGCHLRWATTEPGPCELTWSSVDAMVPAKRVWPDTSTDAGHSRCRKVLTFPFVLTRESLPAKSSLT